jgi:elongation of very long chain fatty acids protein 4
MSLAAIADAYAAFSARVAAASVEIITWANPRTPSTPPTAGWAFVKLEHALLVVVAYCVLVTIGLVQYSRQPRASGAAAEKKKQTSLSAAFAAEPIRFVQLIYNTAQVLLCAVMIAGTVLEARKQDYSLVCNDYKPEGTNMAFWLWVFYLSKIFDFVDTFIMVVRGKYEQFTFLHVYHHISIFLM